MWSSRVVRRAHGASSYTQNVGEDASAAQDDVAVEAADPDHEANRAPCNRQACQTPAISAVDPLGSDPATGTGAHLGRGTHRDQRCGAVHHHVVHNEAIWHQIGSAETIARGLGSLGDPEPDASRFRKKVGQSPICTRLHDEAVAVRWGAERLHSAPARATPQGAQRAPRHAQACAAPPALPPRSPATGRPGIAPA